MFDNQQGKRECILSKKINSKNNSVTENITYRARKHGCICTQNVWALKSSLPLPWDLHSEWGDVLWNVGFLQIFGNGSQLLLKLFYLCYIFQQFSTGEDMIAHRQFEENVITLLVITYYSFLLYPSIIIASKCPSMVNSVRKMRDVCRSVWVGGPAKAVFRAVYHHM